MTQIYIERKDGKGKFSNVPITHGSIVSIDVRFKHIYALIKHDLHTSGNYVLAYCEMPSEQAEVIMKSVEIFK